MFLKKRYFWLNLALYFVNHCIIDLIAAGNKFYTLETLKNESGLILGFIMIIAAIQVWSIYIRKIRAKNVELAEMNEQLESANFIIIESMEHIKALYQSVNILSNQGNREGLIKLLFENIKNVTKSNTIFFYDTSDDNRDFIYEGNKGLKNALQKAVSRHLRSLLEYKSPRELHIFGMKFVIIIIETNYAGYGILGFESTDSDMENSIHRNNINQIQFLSGLISISFERFYLEEINERLLVTEEQNRIANEIHDSVLQRLFSISCGVFSLIKRLGDCSKGDTVNELNLIREATDTTIRELRAKIYGLSWKKSGYNSFKKDIKKYIEDIKKFNDISIPFSIKGNDELLSHSQRKAIYRMICEGVGNAIRHGKADNIDVSLTIDSFGSKLRITDNGTGFDVDRVINDDSKGLGILNLQQLAKSLQGEITINSSPDSYTSIEIEIPSNMVPEKREGSVI